MPASLIDRTMISTNRKCVAGRLLLHTRHAKHLYRITAATLPHFTRCSSRRQRACAEVAGSEGATRPACVQIVTQPQRNTPVPQMHTRDDPTADMQVSKPQVSSVLL